MIPSEAFTEYFRSIYGERWPDLLAALQAPNLKVTLENPFGEKFEDYSLDEASLLPVKHLAAREGDKIADFCASPGGKSLAAIFALHGKAEWFLSDLSPARVTRLRSIFFDCLPEPIRNNVEIKRGDASRWGQFHPERFDRVLVDAPCSGERHLLDSPRELERWSVKGSKRLMVRQHALLCSGLDSLRPGGRLVYSTCSISPIENDGVIEKLHKSRQGLFAVVPVHEETFGEPTQHGWIVLPDRAEGRGPIYFSVLERTT